MSANSDEDQKRQARLNLMAALARGVPFREAFRQYGDPEESYEGFALDEHGNKFDDHVYEENEAGDRRHSHRAVKRAMHEDGYTREDAVKAYGFPDENYDHIPDRASGMPDDAEASPIMITPVDRDPFN